jgi:hypothetical protein
MSEARTRGGPSARRPASGRRAPGQYSRMTPTRRKPTFSYARIAASFAAAGSITIRWCPRSSTRCFARSRIAAGPTPWPWASVARVMSIPAWRKSGLSSSEYWMRPASSPSSSIANAVASPSPRAFRSGFSRSSAPHQRATVGSRRIRSSCGRSSVVSGRTTTPSRSSLSICRETLAQPIGVFMSVWSSDWLSARL